MEISLAALNKIQDSRAISLNAFITGLLHTGSITGQYGIDGMVVSWNELVRYNQCKFPSWDGVFIDSVDTLTGEFLCSVDKHFDRQFKNLLHIPQKGAVIFDINHARDTLAMDELSFLYQSGLIGWYFEPEVKPPLWMLSVRSRDMICIYNTVADKYCAVGKDSCDVHGVFSPEDVKGMLRLLAQHIQWYEPMMWVFTVSGLDLTPQALEYFLELLKEKFTADLCLGQLLIKPK